MRQREILRRLHLDQSACRAIELEPEFRTRVQGSRLRFCGNDEFDVTIVKLVHQRDETPGLILPHWAHLRHAGYDNAWIPASELNVVGLTARSVAKHLEVEPRDTFGALLRRNTAPVDFEVLVAADLTGRLFVKKEIEFLSRKFVVRCEVGSRFLQ